MEGKIKAAICFINEDSDSQHLSLDNYIDPNNYSLGSVSLLLLLFVRCRALKLEGAAGPV